MDRGREASTLQLAALDNYSSKLVTMMLDMLNARLTHTWSSRWPVEGGAGAATSTAQAVLADVDTAEGLACVQQRISAGLAGRTIAWGSGSCGHGVHTLQKPLRLHALLATLTAIESGAEEAPPRYHLREWPRLDAHATASDELRIYSVLTRRPVSVAETARLLGLAVSRVAAVVARLSADQLVECTTASVPHHLPHHPPPAAAGKAASMPGLLGMLRRRFGL